MGRFCPLEPPIRRRGGRLVNQTKSQAEYTILRRPLEKRGTYNEPSLGSGYSSLMFAALMTSALRVESASR